MLNTNNLTTTTLTTSTPNQKKIQILMELAERANPDDINQVIEHLRACDDIADLN